MAGANPPTDLVDPRNVPVPSTASTPDAEMHGPPTIEQNMYYDARSLHLMQQNVEVSFAGEARAAAQAVRLEAELRFREYEDSARNIVMGEMQELRQVAEATNLPVHANPKFQKPNRRLLPLLHASAGRMQTGRSGSTEVTTAATGIRPPNGAVTGARILQRDVVQDPVV